MDYQEYNNNIAVQQEAVAQQSVFIAKVYMWMSIALLITGITAYISAASPAILNLMFNPYTHKPTFLFYALIVGELGLVIAIGRAMHKITLGLAAALFVFYSFINGMTLSMIFLAYTTSSIATTFFITAGTFGVMSLYGYFTKTDLTKLGKILFMALIGVIIAMVVNFFLANSMLDLIISIIGVLVFVGLIAYDTQKIKMIGMQASEGGENFAKLAIQGALSLYLDFINLFLFLLRLFGDRR